MELHQSYIFDLTKKKGCEVAEWFLMTCLFVHIVHKQKKVFPPYLAINYKLRDHFCCNPEVRIT